MPGPPADIRVCVYNEEILAADVIVPDSDGKKMEIPCKTVMDFFGETGFEMIPA